MTPKKKQEEEIIEDIDFEPEATSDQLKKLKERLTECKAERQEFLDGWQRLKADVANNKKLDAERLAREKEQAAAALIKDVLPVLDGYEMARSAASWNEVDEKWRSGIDQLFTQLTNTLEKAGAVRVGAIGEPFDPYKHEAVSMAPAGEGEQPDTVKEVLRSGWQLGERILRPAQVIVTQ